MFCMLEKYIYFAIKLTDVSFFDFIDFGISNIYDDIIFTTYEKSMLDIIMAAKYSRLLSI